MRVNQTTSQQSAQCLQVCKVSSLQNPQNEHFLDILSLSLPFPITTELLVKIGFTKEIADGYKNIKTLSFIRKFVLWERNWKSLHFRGVLMRYSKGWGICSHPKVISLMKLSSAGVEMQSYRGRLANKRSRYVKRIYIGHVSPKSTNLVKWQSKGIKV